MQPTANPKKAIEYWSCSYGKLPPAAVALDTTYKLNVELLGIDEYSDYPTQVSRTSQVCKPYQIFLRAIS